MASGDLMWTFVVLQEAIITVGSIYYTVVIIKTVTRLHITYLHNILHNYIYNYSTLKYRNRNKIKFHTNNLFLSELSCPANPERSLT